MSQNMEQDNLKQPFQSSLSVTSESVPPVLRKGRAGNLSAGDAAFLYCKLATIVPVHLFYNVARGVLVANSRSLKLGDYAAAAVLRTLLEQLSPKELLYLNPHTHDTYQTWLQAKLASTTTATEKLHSKLSVDVEPLPDGASSLMWVGNQRTAKKVILFMHGGGYVFPMLPGHCEWALQYVEAFIDSENEVAVALLEYSLCPPLKYPGQFGQTVAALQHLLDAGWAPSNIVVGGDSVGGQMAHNLLSHIAQPHPDVAPIRMSQDERLAGAFLVSPWVSLDTTTDSYMSNLGIDMLSPYVIERTKANIFGGTSVEQEIAQGQGWIMPMDVPETWVSGWSKATANVYITAGKHEGFATNCRRLAERLREQCGANLNVTYEEPEKESHDWILLEGLQKQRGDATERMLRWVESVFAVPSTSGL